VANYSRQNSAALDYLAQLNEHSTFEAVTSEMTKEFYINSYDINDKIIKAWSKQVPYTEISIKHTEVPNKMINVKEHFVNSSKSKYSSHQITQGFKMTIAYGDNRFTKDPKNMASKFIDILNTNARKAKELNDKATAKQLALIVLSKRFPEGSIEHTEEYTSRHIHGQIAGGYYKQLYQVTLPNGYKLLFNYEILSDSSLYLGFESFKKPHGYDSNINLDSASALIEALKNIA